VKIKIEGFSKNIQKSNLIKIRPMAASCSMWTGGRTDMTQLTIAFRYFANAPKKKSFPD
jgi:hypothetical protein